MTWETLKVRKGGPGLLGRLQVSEGSSTEVRGSRRMREVRLGGNVGKSKPRSRGKGAGVERGEASGVGRLACSKSEQKLPCRREEGLKVKDAAPQALGPQGG